MAHAAGRNLKEHFRSRYGREPFALKFERLTEPSDSIASPLRRVFFGH
jgi:hypothetical protein